MALLAPSFLNSVVAIGTKRGDAPETDWIGTGFIYGVAETGTGDNIRPFLVTNRHVVADEDLIVIKVNRMDDRPAEEFEVNLFEEPHLMTTHPDGLDIAALPLPGEILSDHTLATHPITRGVSLSIAEAGEVGVSEGDGIFAIGFPLGLVGYEDQHFPIVKQGCIARIQDWLSGRSRQILVDANIFPGNSGGPIFLRPATLAVAGTKANATSYLIGIVSEYIAYRDVAVSTQTDRARVIFEENSGIVVVVPSDVIMETVQIAMQNLATHDGQGNEDVKC